MRSAGRQRRPKDRKMRVRLEERGASLVGVSAARERQAALLLADDSHDGLMARGFLSAFPALATRPAFVVARDLRCHPRQPCWVDPYV